MSAFDPAAQIAWLAVIGTGLAYANWFRGIAELPISVSSFLGLLSPLVAAIAGWLVLDQTLTPPQLVGTILVLAAVIAPQLHPRRDATRTDASSTQPITNTNEVWKPGLMSTR